MAFYVYEGGINMNSPALSILTQDVNFKDIKGSTFKDCNMHHVSINNSFITDCLFENANMNHCDLLSTKIFSSTFNNVDLDGADIFSMFFSNCKFINTDFSAAGIEDITFSDCIFEECDFNGVGLKNCQFKNCIFRKIKPDSSTFSLNRFEKCTFSDCIFKGSFVYQIFQYCQFDKVIIDSNILKYNYGLGNLLGITYLYKAKEMLNGDMLKQNLLADCVEQKLFINAVLVDYNFSHEINPKLAVKTIEAINIMIKKELLLRADELTFLKNLFHHLFINNLIAPIVLYRLFEELKKIDIGDCHNNIVLNKSRETLYIISNSLYFDFCDFCEQLKKTIGQTNSDIVPVNIKIHYNEEPKIPLDLMLNQYFPNTFRRISTEEGSFLEYLEVGQYGLEILNIFLQLLGITIPIIYSEIKEKHKKSQPQTVIRKNVEINVISSQADKNVSELIQNTCQLINSSDILVDDQQGYNNTNIQEIEVQYHINIQA